MDMKIVGITVAILVSITVLAGVLMPVLDDATATTDKFTNEGLFYLKQIDASTDSVLVWDHTNPTSITVDSVDIELPQSTTYPLTLLCSDTWGLRYLVDNNGNTVTLFDNTASTKFTVSAAGDDDLTITISGGTATFTDGGSNTFTESFTSGYSIAESGDYVMKIASEKAYLNGDSVIYSTGRSGGLSGLISTTASMHLDGTIDDGITVTSLFPTTYTASNAAITYSAVAGYEDLYSFEKVTFTVTDANSHSANATYSQVIIPHEVTAERSVHFTDNENALFAVIPMLVIVAILIGVVALVIRSRLD